MERDGARKANRERREKEPEIERKRERGGRKR